MASGDGVKLILNGKLLDGTGAAVREGWGLRIEGERIAAVGPVESLGPVPPEAEILDAGGRTVMPGLIESHFHFSFNDGPSIPVIDPRIPPDYVAICAARTAETALASGYTAVRSGGCMYHVDLAVKLAIERGLIRGPRVKPSGQE